MLIMHILTICVRCAPLTISACVIDMKKLLLPMQRLSLVALAALGAACSSVDSTSPTPNIGSDNIEAALEDSGIAQNLSSDQQLLRALKTSSDSAAVVELLDRGANINAFDEYGFPAFFYLLAVRDSELVQKAITEHGADPSIETNDLDALEFARGFWQPQAAIGELKTSGSSYSYIATELGRRVAEDFPALGKVPSNLLLDQVTSFASVATALWRIEAVGARDWSGQQELIMADFEDWLASAQSRRLELDAIPQPALPEAPVVTKGPFESNAMFQERQAAARAEYNQAIAGIAADFSERVDKRNQALATLKRDKAFQLESLELTDSELRREQGVFYAQLRQQFREQVEPRIIIEALAKVCGAFELVLTNPESELPDYNPESEIMRAVLRCSRAQYQQELNFQVPAGVLAQTFHSLLEDGLLIPEAFLQVSEGGQVSINNVILRIGDTSYSSVNVLSPIIAAGTVDLNDFFATGLKSLPAANFNRHEIQAIDELEIQSTELSGS